MRCPAIELLTEIRDRLRNLDTLAHKRAVKAAQQARYRASHNTGGPTSVAAAGGTDATRAEGDSPTQPKAERVPPVDTTQCVDTTKEDEKGKETFPPAPPIEKSEKEKKGAGEGEDARAREVSSEVLRAERKREARVAKVAAYNAELGGDIDADYFVDYYAGRWPRDWRARLRNWLKEDKPSGRIQPEEDGAARTPPPQETDWTLCAERCANCRGDGCTCGIKVPPPCEAHPRPPEECTSYQPLTTNS